MAQRVLQAQVVDPSVADDFDEKKRFWKLALFNPDGTPYVAPSGGVPSDPAALTDLENRVTTLEGASPADISGLEDRITALENAPAGGGGGGADLTNLDPNTRIQWRDQTTGDVLAEMYLDHPPEGQYLYAVAYKTNGAEDHGLLLASADNFVDALVRAADGETNGLFYWLGTNRGAQAWSNPAGAGGPVVVSVSSSNPYDFNGPWVVPSEVSGRNGRGAHEEWASTQTPGQWIKWDLGATHRMVVTEYALMRYADFSPTQQVAHWKLQGSNNNIDWTDLDARDVTDQDPADTWRRLVLAAPDPGTGTGWRYLRLLSTGPNTGGADQFVLSEAEFYGTLRAVGA
jgi:hypothetical protein